MKSLPLSASFLFCTAGLAGCAAIQADQAKYHAQLQAADQAKCEGYGYQPDTDAHADCMMQLDRERQWQQANAQRQADENRQREADRQAMKEAAEAQARTAQPKEMDGFIPKSAEDGFTPKSIDSGADDDAPSIPTGENCKTTTTTTQTDNAGSTTTKIECVE